LSSKAPTLATLVASAEWLPHQLDVAGRRVLFVRLAAAEIRAASFLDERVLTGTREGAWVPLAELLAALAPRPRAAPHVIFHVGHCGSTLVANLLERLPGAIAMREPLALRALAELAEELPRASTRLDEARWQTLTDALLALYARPHDGAHVVVKATSSCNALIEPWLAQHPGTRALLVSIALEPYLATILKSPAARADALRFAPARLEALHRVVGDDGVRLPVLADAEQIALGWLAEQARFAAAKARFGARVARLDFAELLRDGAAGFARIAAHFGFAGDDAALARAWHPDVLGRYAKARDHAYSPDDREADLAEARRRHGDEIAAGLAFAATLRERYASLPR